MLIFHFPVPNNFRYVYYLAAIVLSNPTGISKTTTVAAAATTTTEAPLLTTTTTTTGILLLPRSKSARKKQKLSMMPISSSSSLTNECHQEQHPPPPPPTHRSSSSSRFFVPAYSQHENGGYQDQKHFGLIEGMGGGEGKIHHSTFFNFPCILKRGVISVPHSAIC